MKTNFQATLLSFFIFIACCFAQAPKLIFRHITNEQGLSNSTIEAIFQDSKGFIWFGTRDGLNRYDGYQVVVYRYNAKDSNSISDNYIRFIYEDRNQTLWVATINGLNQFDRAKNNFTRYKHDPNKPASLSNNDVTCLREDHKGNFWVSTLGGLNLLNRQNKSFVQFHHHPDQSNSPGDDSVNYLFEDGRKNLWIGTENGLTLFNPATRTFTAYTNRGDKNSTRANNVIKIVNQDKRGNLWLATEENGLFLFDPKKNTFIKYNHIEKDPASLASNLVRSILVDRKGNTWIGSVNGGLDLFNAGSNSFIHYQNEPENVSSLSQRTVSALFEDNQENLWVGTHRGGVNLYTPNKEKFGLFRQQAGENTLSYNDVKTFCEDQHGNIWIGTDGGGLNLFDRGKNSFVHYKYNPFDTKSIGSNEVLDVMEDSESNLWVGTWGGGLNLFDRSSGKFIRYLNDPSNINSISSDYVQKIFEDRNKNLWIATYYGGLNLFDRRTRKFSRITGDVAHATRLYGNNVVSLNEDRGGNIWIGTDDGGLNCFNTTERKFYHYFNTEQKLPDVRVLFIDNKGNLWVGQEGLYLFNAKRNSFSLYPNKAGLSNEFIKGMEEDKQGNFWIATSNGITQFNPETQSFKKYNTADGLQGSEFEANASLNTKNGEIFFGGINGFNSFYPENIRVNKFIPPVFLTGFQVFNQQIFPAETNSPLKEDISVAKKILLSYKQSTFSFDFSALNYTASENNQYAYRLQGLEKNWNYVGKERKASYTNVGPGEYTFRVKASNNDGVWNQKGASVIIIIAPPFWDTWWFKLLVTAAVIIAALAFYKFRRKVELRKQEEIKREEMHQLQLQFFTNISHEFRTPLSLILGPAERLQKEDPQSSFTHYYQVIYRNAIRLTNLINELMDFRKAESGALKLHVMPGNLALFLQEIAEEFSELANQKKINFSVRIPGGLSDIWFDRQVLEKIIINLLSNSFKYSADNSTITAEVLLNLDNFTPSFENELILKTNYKGKNYIYLRVADNGIGISKESISHLFERYYRISESHLGSGIGLAFVKSLAFLHKGSIYVYSERNKGTEIIIALPVSKEDYKKTERWGANTNEIIKWESIDPGNYYDPGPEVNGNGIENRAKDRNTPHILVVDDNRELRQFLHNSLSAYYNITEAEDGQSGLTRVKEVFPDLIISDVMMPGMNGIEFCRLIKEDIETSHIPFLMLTAKDALNAKIEGMESGADFYFAKPLSMDLLLLTIQNIFAQKQRLKERYTKDRHVEANERVHSVKDKKFVDDLVSLIESQLTNPEMDIDYICNKTGMSRTKLYEKIKGITGQSIGEFVRTIRLKTAVHIMTHEDLLIIDVMYRVGIQTQSYFTKAFKKEFGKTPGKFLQELKK